jgi:hypothetical protein
MEILESTIDPRILVAVLAMNFLIYVGAVWIKFGVQKSISASYYSWKGLWRSLFVIFCWVLAFPLILLGLSLPEPIQQIAYLSGSGFGFVGAASMIRQPSVLKIHMKAALIGIGAGLAMIGFGFGGWYWLSIGIGAITAGLLFLFDVKNKIWWAELLAIGVIMGSLIFRYFFENLLT